MAPLDLPLILLVFSNVEKRNLDGSYSERYLPSLEQEQNNIVEAIRMANQQLAKQGDKPICEWKVLSNKDATMEKICEAFITYKNRIVAFHFAGHADGYQLLLQSAEKQDSEIALAGGLISFFRLQTKLKFVFLNGCKTRQMAEDLHQKGIPAVIGSARDIDDHLAKVFAHRFYQSLVRGVSLKVAWGHAIAFVQIKQKIKSEIRPEKSLRSIILDLDDNHNNEEYWDLYSESLDWNLGSEAGNPLLGLPEPAPTKEEWPKAPFIYLERYQEKHSKIFFGRRREIRRLFSLIIAQEDDPLILFYGQSGVGKSSVLEAGLFPRLRSQSEVLGNQIAFARRDPNSGLLASLTSALAESKLLKEKATKDWDVLKLVTTLLTSSKSTTTVTEHLPPNPFKTKIPKLLIVLDQVEESFTRPLGQGENKADCRSVEQEWEELLEALSPILLNPHFRKDVKVIFSFRKEYHPDIQTHCKRFGLQWKNLFLRPPDAESIREVVQGIDSTEDLRLEYKTRVKADIPDKVVKHLMEDTHSPISPILQVFLSEMWEKVEDHPNRIFNNETYLAVKRDGDGKLNQFFKEQLEKLELKAIAEQSSLVSHMKAGLVLDLLQQHTTAIGTADECTPDQLNKKYLRKESGINPEELQALISKLVDARLLLQPNKNGPSRLAHDTLAPLVRKAYAASNSPGQRAAHILNSKIPFFKEQPPEGNKSMSSSPQNEGQSAKPKSITKRKIPLWQKLENLAEAKADDSDPKVLSAADLHIIEDGRKGMSWNEERQEVVAYNQENQNKQRDKTQRSRIWITGLALLMSVLIFSGLRELARTKNMSKKLTAYKYLLAQTEQEDGEGSAERDLALASQAFLHNFPNEDSLILEKLVGNHEKSLEQPGILIALDTIELRQNDAVTIAPDGHHVFVLNSDSAKAQLISLRTGKEKRKVEEILEIKDSTIRVITGAFSTAGNHLGVALASNEDRGLVLIKDLRSEEKEWIYRDTFAQTITSIDFAQDTALMVLGTADGHLLIWNYIADSLDSLIHFEGKIVAVKWGPDKKNIWAEWEIHNQDDVSRSFRWVWNAKGKWREKEIPYNFIDFSMNEKEFVGYSDGRLSISLLEYSSESLQETKTNILFPARSSHPYLDGNGNIILQVENRAWVFSQNEKGQWEPKDIFEFNNKLKLIQMSSDGVDLLFLSNKGEIYRAKEGKSPLKWVEEQHFATDKYAEKWKLAEPQKLTNVLSRYYDEQQNYIKRLKILLFLAFVNYLIHFYFSRATWNNLIDSLNKNMFELYFHLTPISPVYIYRYWFIKFVHLLITTLLFISFILFTNLPYLIVLGFIGIPPLLFNILQLWRNFKPKRYLLFFTAWLPLFIFWTVVLQYLTFDFDFGKFGFMEKKEIFDHIFILLIGYIAIYVTLWLMTMNASRILRFIRAMKLYEQPEEYQKEYFEALLQNKQSEK